jgi:hypothetical protein
VADEDALAAFALARRAVGLGYDAAVCASSRELCAICWFFRSIRRINDPGSLEGERGA